MCLLESPSDEIPISLATDFIRHTGDCRFLELLAPVPTLAFAVDLRNVENKPAYGLLPVRGKQANDADFLVLDALEPRVGARQDRQFHR